MAIAIILGLVALQTSCGDGGEGPAVSVEDKYSKIEKDMVSGSTQAEVLAYLDENHIVRGPVEVAGDYPEVTELREDIADTAPIIQARIWGPEGPEGPLWQVYFLFDDSQRLTDIATIRLGPTRP